MPFAALSERTGAPRGPLYRRLRTWSVTCGLSDHDIVIAVDEIVTNALEHGHPPPASRSWTTPNALFIQIDDGRGSCCVDKNRTVLD